MYPSEWNFPTGVSLGVTLFLLACGGTDGVSFIGPGGNGNIGDDRPATWTTYPAMPEAVLGFATAILDSSIYVAGGERMSGTLSDSFIRFNLITNQWETLAALPDPVRDAALIAWFDAVYLAGGLTRNQSNAPVVLDSFYRYNDASNQWEPRPSLPQPLYQGIGGVMDERIAVVLGRATLDGPPVDAVGFDPARQAWDPLENPNSMRIEAAGTTVSGDIIIVGGLTWPDEHPVKAMEIRHNDGWQPMGNLPEFRFGMAIGFPGLRLQLFGGVDESGVPATPYANRFEAGASPARWDQFTLPDFELPVTDHRVVLGFAGLFIVGGRYADGSVSRGLTGFQRETN